MGMNSKFAGILVLAIFLISAVPLAMARYGDSSGSGQVAQGSITGSVLASGAGNGDSDDSGSDSGNMAGASDDGEADDDSGSDDASGNKDDWLDVGAHRFSSPDECVEAYRQRFPDADEGRIMAACTYAFQVKEMLAPKFGDNLPRVQKFMVQNQDQIREFLDKLDEKSANIVQKLDRARLNECLEDTEACNENMQHWKVQAKKVGEMIRERVVEKSKLMEANKNFLRAKSQYEEAKKSQLQARNDFLGLKEQLQQCKEDGGDNCTEIEEQLLEKAKDNMIALADRLIQHLDKIKSKVEAAENLNEDDADEMISKINDYITKLEDAKEAIEAAETQEELKQAADELRAIWDEMEYYAKKYAERVVHAYTRGVFVRSELLEDKLEDVLERLEDKGVDTSGMEALLDDFSSYIDEARDKMKEASELFNEAKELRDSGDKEGAKEKLEEAKELTKEAHEALKEAHKIIMELVKEINKSGVSFDPDEIDEDDDVEVVEDDDEDDEDEEDED